MKTGLACVLSLVALCGPASSAWAAKPVAQRRFEQLSSFSNFQAYHPDVRYRQLGLKAYREGHPDEEVRRFERASRYADKPSQAMLAEMYWQGAGMPADRVLGYIWMDLAAERGYPDFLVLRERYWEQLDPDERAQVPVRAAALLDVYGDEAARPRLESWLRRGMAQVTGSRTGYVATLALSLNDGWDSDNETYRGHEYYATAYWRPDAYWRLQDRIRGLPARERVDVGVPESLRPAGPAGRVPGE